MERTGSLKFKSDGVLLVDASSSYLYGLAGCNRPVSSALDTRCTSQGGLSKQKSDPRDQANTDIPTEVQLGL
jgi:hypothetical protein